MTLHRRDFTTLGLEVEIAFRFARPFVPQSAPYAAEEVLESIGAVMATIEIVSSRYRDWPQVDKLAQLADLQNHGALVVGEALPYDRGYPWLTPAASLELDGERLDPEPSANPAGDPRRLLPWLVNHACTRGIAITPETVVTTGSYTGLHFAQREGVYVGRLQGLPPVALHLLA